MSCEPAPPLWLWVSLGALLFSMSLYVLAMAIEIFCAWWASWRRR